MVGVVRRRLPAILLDGNGQTEASEGSGDRRRAAPVHAHDEQPGSWRHGCAPVAVAPDVMGTFACRFTRSRSSKEAVDTLERGGEAWRAVDDLERICFDQGSLGPSAARRAAATSRRLVSLTRSPTEAR